MNGAKMNDKMKVYFKRKVYLTSIEKTKDWHRSHFIIHWDGWYFAEFQTGRQLDFFLRTIGVCRGETIERRFIDTLPSGETDNLYVRCWLSIDYIDEHMFMTMAEVPEKAKPIKALSNGSIVTCYYLLKGKTLHWYRPNPNAGGAVYDPISDQEHIAYMKLYGLY